MPLGDVTEHRLVRSGANLLVQPDALTCGAATVTNTDTVNVVLQPGSQFAVDLSGGVLGPGSSLEGTTAEIEVAVTQAGTATGAELLVVRGAATGETFGVGAAGVAVNNDTDVDITYPALTTQLLLDAGAGVDTVSADNTLGAGAPLTNQRQLVRLGDGDDTFNGSTGTDRIEGGEGDDQIDVGDGITNSLDGGPGDDFLTGGTGSDAIFDGTGADTVIAASGSDTITASTGFSDENDTYGLGGNAGDTISYGERLASVKLVAGPNVVGGGPAEQDTIVGAANWVGGRADDLLVGAVGANMSGSDGDDTYVPPPGSTLFQGGNGNDLIDGSAFSTWTFDISADFFAHFVGATGVSVNTTSVKSLIGGPGNDTFTGDADANTFIGGAGTDVATGGAGDDTLDGGDGGGSISGGPGNDDLDSGDGVDVVNGDDGDDQIDTGDGNDLVTGGAGNDDIEAGGDTDDIDGGPGDDEVDGEGGDGDVLHAGSAADGADELDGGSGEGDVLDYSARTAALSVTLDDVANDGAAGELDEVDDDVELVRLGSGADTFVGDLTSSESVVGGAGDDVLDTGGTAESVVEQVTAGDGADTLSFARWAAGVTATTAGATGVGAPLPLAATGVEHLTGSASGDTLTGDASFEHDRAGCRQRRGARRRGRRHGARLRRSRGRQRPARRGAGQRHGSRGRRARSRSVSAPRRGRGDDGAGAALGDVDDVFAFEVLVGGGASDVLLGSDAAERIVGGTGDDTLGGGGGADALSGEVGNEHPGRRRWERRARGRRRERHDRRRRWE